MATITPARREAIRRAIQIYLADRRSLSMRADAIHAEITAQGHAAPETVISEELTYLTDAGYLTVIRPAGAIVARYRALPKLCDAADTGEI